MEAYRIVNKVPTKVLTFGKGVGDDLLDVKNLIVLFPGQYFDIMLIHQYILVNRYIHFLTIFSRKSWSD